MYALALKEAYAIERGHAQDAEVCAAAQRRFLQDHLGQWIGMFAERLGQLSAGSPYLALAQLAVAFVHADAERLGAQIKQRRLMEVRPTPLGPELSCGGCALAGALE
jgi:hypothetical protein